MTTHSQIFFICYRRLTRFALFPRTVFKPLIILHKLYMQEKFVVPYGLSTL